MGQPIAVTQRRGTHQQMLRFELNRNLTGMGHERYRSAEIEGDRPPDELARRLFASGQVAAVHCYMNMVTVELRPGADGEGLADTIEALYRFYGDGDETSPTDQAVEEPGEGSDSSEV